MPEISRFYGIVISMNWWEPRHHSPHIHAHYGADQATVDINSGQLLAGSLPGRVLSLVREWMMFHRTELHELWSLAQRREPLFKDNPLE